MALSLPKGFLYAGSSAGLKNDGKKDVAVVYSEVPSIAAGLFTTNAIKAAPVTVSMEQLRKGRKRMIIANSGIANAATAKDGVKDVNEIISAYAKGFDIRQEEILVASTGIIGRRLPVEKVVSQITALKNDLSRQGFMDAVKAIMTTDTVPKYGSRRLKIGSKETILTGFVKGSGMIQPHLATMLGFFTSDANITQGALKKALLGAAEASFNRITIDGEMSTNDTVLVMANGLAENDTITDEGRHYAAFEQAFIDLTRELAEKMVKDGEGANKVIEINVTGARNEEDARRVSFKLANSPLIKTAFFGEDPNWGRIVATVGAACSYASETGLKIWIGKQPVFSSGKGIDNESLLKVRNSMKNRTIQLTVDLGAGNRSFNVMTCDLTYDYIRINSTYTS
ncbi:MAG: bifunctional glutamate N-acetyltransferase/amino-acid acetyltransferase ArgJ [Deltaproteobacteria bacterium]|nr:bifunctional glutamate N-acetyltransferase/amino-acid acetyltransferase ArgJ [Deltaproteobacteria bacterium]